MDKKQFYLATIDANAHTLAKEFGFGIEISEYCTAYNMDQHFHEVDPQVREKVTCSDRFVLHAPYNELFPCAIDPKARELAKERYLQAIELAQRYGADKVVIHGGYNHWIYFPVWYTEQSIPFWKDFLPLIPEGITVCLENVLEDEPDMLLDIIKAVDDPKIRMCMDIGHVNSYAKVGVMEWMERCADYISHFHIHNNDTSWDTHSPLDQGTIPMKEFLARGDQLCPDATYTLELMESESSIRWLMEEVL